MAVQIIDHVQITVSDYAKAREFYTKALAPLGWTMMMEFPMGGDQMAGGLGTQGKPYVWISNKGKPSITGHVALGAHSEAAVNAFYTAAMGAGGTDNGSPGLRKEYHDKYYVAFVRDPDGNNIEAVWQGQSDEVMAEVAKARTAPKRRASAAKKPAARKAAAKKPPAKRAAAKKPAARKAPAKKAAAKKPAGRGRRGGR